MSDGSLAEQLVTAAEAKIATRYEIRNGGRELRDYLSREMARDAVVAVLRTLDRWYWQHDSDMAQLDAGLIADEIETRYVSPFNTSAPRVKNPGDL